MISNADYMNGSGVKIETASTKSKRIKQMISRCFDLVPIVLKTDGEGDAQTCTHEITFVLCYVPSGPLMFPSFRLDPETEQDGAGEIESACFYGARNARNVTR